MTKGVSEIVGLSWVIAEVYCAVDQTLLVQCAERRVALHAAGECVDSNCGHDLHLPLCTSVTSNSTIAATVRQGLIVAFFRRVPRRRCPYAETVPV